MAERRTGSERYPHREVGNREVGSVGMFLLAALASLAVVTAKPSARRSSTTFAEHRFSSLQGDRFSQRQSNPIELLTTLRGGSADPSSADGYSAPPQHLSQEYQPPPPQQQQQPRYEYPAEQVPPNPVTDDIPFHETFQDRVDNWRKYQLEHAEEQRLSLSPRDDQGRLKLLGTSVGKGSRALTFFILMWRNVHLYEVVDAKFKGNLRFMGVLPLTFLFVANMAGVVASITSSGHSSKKRLKAILNLNKLVEIFLIVSHVGMLLFSTSNMVPREIYISNILHSVFFILQCQAVTRFVWDEALLAAPQATGTYPENDWDDEGRFPPPQQQLRQPQQQPIQNNPNYNQGPYRE